MEGKKRMFYTILFETYHYSVNLRLHFVVVKAVHVQFITNQKRML